MQRTTPLATVLLVGAVAILTLAPYPERPATAAAKMPRPDPKLYPVKAERHGPHVVKRYLALRREVAEKLSPRRRGRNILLVGVLENGEARKAETPELRAAIARYERWLNPPAVSQHAVSMLAAPIESAAPAPALAPVTGGVSNATVQCESGGDYSIDTGNGYYGGYQFDSQTWDAYGDPVYGEANEAPPAVQDQAAASVPYDAWPSCP